MKKIFLSVALMATVAFVGCSKDDDNNASGNCVTCTDFGGIKGEIKYCVSGDKITYEVDGKTLEYKIPAGSNAAASLKALRVMKECK